MGPPARRAAGAIAAVLALVALAAWFSGRVPEAREPAPAATQENQSVPSSAKTVATPAPQPADLDALLERIPARADLPKRAAADYRERARFPAWSRPLADGIDPILRDRAVTPGTSLPRSLEPRLEIAPDRSTYVFPAPVRVTARLQGTEGPEPARELYGEIRDPTGQTVATLRFEDEGNEGYVAVFDAEAEGVLRGAYLIAVSAETLAGEDRSASTGFLYSHPGADLTGRYRDALVKGNLVIEAEVEVFTEGRFHLEATLADGGGRPLAWAQAADWRPEGRSWLPVTFFGLALREQGADGPYRLASIALTTIDGMPNQKSDLVLAAHVTAPYHASDFRAEPFNDPALLRAADQLDPP